MHAASRPSVGTRRRGAFNGRVAGVRRRLLLQTGVRRLYAPSLAGAGPAGAICKTIRAAGGACERGRCEQHFGRRTIVEPGS